MMTKQIIDRSGGQVALVVLLISAVVLTLGLSISRKTVVETRIDTDEELLRQAFNTAESGVDYYLSTGETRVSLEDGSSASINTSNIGEGSGVLDFDEVTTANQNSVFWMSGHDEDGIIQLSGGTYFNGDSVRLCVNDSFVGAVKVDYFYYDSGTSSFNVKRMGYNINSSNYIQNYIDRTPSNGSCSARSSMKQIDVTGLLGSSTSRSLMMAVTPLGGSTRLVVSSASGVFPSQGEEIIGTGTVTTEAASGTVTSMVRVYNKYRIPSFMLDAVTSLSSIN